MGFKEQLTKLRKRNNMTQTDLAKLMDVKQYVISSWEIGRSEPTISQLKMLSNIFKISVDYLLDKDVVLVSNEEEFNIVTNEMIKDSIDDFEVCINNIRENCTDKQKKEISIILK